MNDELSDPGLRKLDREISREAGASHRRFWIGLLIGALAGLAIPIVDFFIQTFLLPLNPITVCVCAFLGGIIGLLTSRKAVRSKQETTPANRVAPTDP